MWPLTVCLNRLSVGEAGSKKFYDKRSENSRTQIVFRTDIFQKLALGAPDWSHWSAIVTLKITYWKYWLHVNIRGAISCNNFSSATKTNSFLSGTKTSVARGRSRRLKMDSLVIFKEKWALWVYSMKAYVPPARRLRLESTVVNHRWNHRAAFLSASNAYIARRTRRKAKSPGNFNCSWKHRMLCIKGPQWLMGLPTARKGGKS